MILNNICIYFLLFIIYSFLGWTIEVVRGFYFNKRFIDRGVLIGPICPIYGFGTLAMIISLSKYKSEPLILFFMSIIIFSFLEYFTSLLLEKVFKARWWDYSNRKLNINGRICLETMIPFGLLGCFVMYVLNPLFLNIISKIDIKIVCVIATIIFTLFVIDNVFSYYIMFKYKVTLNNASKDATEEISLKIKNIFVSKGILYKRLVHAFPSVKITNDNKKKD